MSARRDRLTSTGSRWVAAFFVAALVVSMWGYYAFPRNYPPYLDYDSATLGIFVNNVTYQDQYDHYFNKAPIDQDQYRMYWAAHFLPAAIPLSWIQRLLRIPPSRVGDLLKGTTLLCGLLGCLCVAGIAMRRQGWGWLEGAFLVGFVAALPPYLLYLRTGVTHFLLSFLLFWWAVYLIVRYLDSRKPRHLYVLAMVLGYYLVVPYSPLLALPVVGVWLVIQRGALASVVRDKHVYVAAIVAVGLSYAICYGAAVTHDVSYEAWHQKAARFVSMRSKNAISMNHLSPALAADKVAKLWHQHFYFQRDELGDPSREDELWTLPSPHVVWLGLVPIGIFGLWLALREREPISHVFVSVLVASYLIAMTVGFPEGRYLITVVPCYAYFVLLGLERLVSRPVALPAVLGLAMLLTAGNSFALMRGEYNTSVEARWQATGAMREALALIQERYGPEYGTTEWIFMTWPNLRYKDWLYLEMLGNMKIAAYVPGELTRYTKPGRVLFAIVLPDNTPQIRGWQFQGFTEIGRVTDGVTGREVLIFAKG